MTKYFPFFILLLLSGYSGAAVDPLIKYQKVNTWNQSNLDRLTRHQIHLIVTRVILPKFPIGVPPQPDPEAGLIRKFLDENCSDFLRESFGDKAPVLNPGIVLDLGPDAGAVFKLPREVEITSFKLVRNSQLFDPYEGHSDDTAVLVVNAICNR